jgi:hypothetical protein
VQRASDCRSNAIAIAEYFMIPEADHRIALASDNQRSIRVRRGFMLAAIGLDDQLSSAACEIDHVAADRDLPPEMKVGKILAQDAPEPLLGVGGLTPQAARDRNRSCWRSELRHCAGLPRSPHP